jgi:hypothetical protein
MKVSLSSERGWLANPPLQADGRVGRPPGSLSRPPLNGSIVGRT